MADAPGHVQADRAGRAGGPRGGIRRPARRTRRRWGASPRSAPRPCAAARVPAGRAPRARRRPSTCPAAPCRRRSGRRSRRAVPSAPGADGSASSRPSVFLPSMRQPGSWKVATLNQPLGTQCDFTRAPASRMVPLTSSRRTRAWRSASAATRPRIPCGVSCRHHDRHLEAGGERVLGERIARVSLGRDHQALESQAPRQRRDHRHAPVLEAARRVRAVARDGGPSSLI
jgi:hypothetical protein